MLTYATTETTEHIFLNDMSVTKVTYYMISLLWSIFKSQNHTGRNWNGGCNGMDGRRDVKFVE